MTKSLSASAQKVQQALNELGLTLEVLELPASTRTAVEAAQAIGCNVGQIVKSLVFKAKRSKRPILVVASGANRVDEKKVENLFQEPLGKANAEFVRQYTGFAIGGVPPVGHTESLTTFIDEDLTQHEQIWAAAGTPHAVFCLSPGELEKMTQGKIVDIKKT